MNYCPCCTDILLPHIGGHGVYWFCRNCWQVMPVCTHHSVCSTEVIPKELPLMILKRREHFLASTPALNSSEFVFQN